MTLVNPSSLSATLDAVNAALFWGQPIDEAERVETAEWIALRQRQPGGYHHGAFPAPLEADFGGRAHLFTGEVLDTWAGTAHALGEEACRAMLLLRVDTPYVQAALTRASDAMADVLGLVLAEGWFEKRPGEFCCAKCSVAVWRHMAAGGLREIDPQRWLEGGLRSLQALREGGGRWRRYPFYYTLLALTEMDLPGARDELRYAAPACEHVAKRDASEDEYAVRRRDLAVRALALCG